MNTERKLDIKRFTEEVKRNAETKPGDGYVGKAILADRYYGVMLTGLETPAEAFAKMCMENMDLPIPVKLISSILDWKKVQGNVVYRLMNAGENTAILSESPHTLFLDLVQVYYLDFPGTPDKRFSIRITNELLRHWDISTEKLHLCAQRNMQKRFPAKICDICDILKENGKELTEEKRWRPVYPPLYVLTNQEAFYGAAAILYSGALEMFAGRCSSNVVILPSSIHEGATRFAA